MVAALALAEIRLLRNPQVSASEQHCQPTTRHLSRICCHQLGLQYNASPHGYKSITPPSFGQSGKTMIWVPLPVTTPSFPPLKVGGIASLLLLLLMLTCARAPIPMHHTGIPGVFKPLGFIGSPVATAVATWGMLLSLTAYLACSSRLKRMQWPGWSASSLSLSKFGAFAKVALPLGVAICLEELQIQSMTIMAGALGSVAVSAHSLMLQVRWKAKSHWNFIL